MEVTYYQYKTLGRGSLSYGTLKRGSRVRELWSDKYAAVATRRHRTLPLQRVRTLLQDERTEQASNQAKAKIGECKNPTNLLHMQ
ncbi:hypothetical protein RR46_08582 [Papilio xuthus]|uniref:Uncharacterized protein n=1 Tax=Papilio xuthus TaxID=66420 RepID=A0A194Q986_PAPXU|nr:hypothetical protein RR46_08582 [Papilio xuthus]